MKRCKRTLALLLCAVLCFTALPVSTFAAEDWPEKTDPIEAFFTTGSFGSAESTGRFPAYSDTDRTTWSLSDGVLIIDGTGMAASREDLFKDNPYIETVIVKEGITQVGSSLFLKMPNLKNVIVMSNQTVVNKIVRDCPNMNNFIMGANLDNEAMKCLPEDIDRVKVTLGGLTGMAGGSASVARPVPIANSIVISSDYGNVATLTNDAKALITEMNLPASALALLPAELGGTFSDSPIVSDWAQDFVASAKKNYLLTSSLGNDYTRNITRAQFADLAIQTYEQLTGDNIKGDYISGNFADCKIHKYPGVVKAYALGILTGYNSSEYRIGIYIGPNDPITREQAAAMLARLAEALGKPLPAAGSTPFTDTVSDWAQENVAQVYAAGIMTGTSNTTFSAKSNYTIEQSIATMVRMAEYVNQ